MKLLPILFFINLLAFGQAHPVTIYGKLTNDKNEILSDISMTLWGNRDSLTTVASDAKGEFTIATEFDKDKTYMLTFDYRYQSQSDIILYQPSDSVIMSEFVINVQLVKNVAEGLSSSSEFYFPIDKVNETEGLDLEFIKMLIETYPQICILLEYKGSNDEKKDLVEKRLKYLRELLIKNNIPLEYFQFKDDHQKIRQYEKDQRARFWVSVISLEGC